MIYFFLKHFDRVHLYKTMLKIRFTKKFIFLAAQKAGCHLSRPVPVAIVKASEVVLGLALPKDVSLQMKG